MKCQVTYMKGIKTNKCLGHFQAQSLIFRFHSRCGNRYTHANRQCPLHPLNKPIRSTVLSLTPSFSAGEDREAVVAWIEKYRQEREEKTPAKMEDPNKPERAEFQHLDSAKRLRTKRGLEAELEQQENSPGKRPLNLTALPPAPIDDTPKKLGEGASTPQKSLLQERLVLSPRRRSPLTPKQLILSPTKRVPLSLSPKRLVISSSPQRRVPPSPRRLLHMSPRRIPISPRRLDMSPLRTAQSSPPRRLLLSPKRRSPLSSPRRQILSPRRRTLTDRMNPKKRWLQGLFEEEQQKRNSTEELARPIQWNDDEPSQASAPRSPSRSRSPTTWHTAATLVELRSSAEASPPSSSSAPVDDDQPLNLSISSSRS